MFQRHKTNAEAGFNPENSHPGFTDRELLDAVYASLNKLIRIDGNNADILKNFSVVVLTALQEFCLDNDEHYAFEQIPPELEHLVSGESLDAVKEISKHVALLKRKDFHVLFALSPGNLLRLEEAVCKLSDNGLLTSESYLKALNLIKCKPPRLPLSILDKKSRKNHDISNSQFSVSNTDFAFFIEHNKNKEYPHGACGKVKQAHNLKKDAQDTEYAIKIYFENFGAEKLARKNARFQKLLGRETWLCKRNNTFSTIYQWQEGKVLSKFNKNELTEIPLITRFNYMIDGLSQLEKLHEKLFVHGDLGPQNFIINSGACRMSLIDCDSARKYTDAYSFHNDICSMGETIASMFPELNTKKKRDMSQIEYAVFLLKSAMIVSSPSEMCTTKDALHFASEVFAIVSQANPDSLGNDLIKEIAQDSIFQETLCEEHVLRGITK